MSSSEFLSPDPSEITASYLVNNTGQVESTTRMVLFPLTLANGEIPEPGVSYTPRITRSREVGNFDAADESLDYKGTLISVLPAPTPPTPVKLIRS